MQTFLPFPDFQQSLLSLDPKRLGKQRVEAKQILNVVEGKSLGWQHHPAVKMWMGHRDQLAHYLNLAITIWIEKGYNNNMLFEDVPIYLPELPWYIGYEPFHASHRSNLKRKDAKYYPFAEPDDLEYLWPHAMEHKYYLKTIKNGWQDV